MYTRTTVDLCQQMRRHIRAEFGEQIPLDSPNLIERLLAYVPRSRAQVPARLAEQELEAQAEALVYYRGAALRRQPAPVPKGVEVGQARPRRIYRGQIIG